MTMTRRILMELCMTFTVIVLFAAIAAAQMPQATTQKVKGDATVTTQEMRGEVLYVEGSTVVIKMSTGEVKTFTDVPASRTALIDGKEVSARDLKPGTKLTATITTTATPVTVRTATVGSGKVWFVAPPNVILTLPNGENRQYKAAPGMKFTVDGRSATVFDLRKGMTVAAEKIVEEPRTEIASNTRIVGQAPAATSIPQAEPAPAPAPVRAAVPPPVPVAAPAPEPEPAAAPAAPKLPKTASPLPLMGLLGLLCVGGSFGIRMLRRS